MNGLPETSRSGGWARRLSGSAAPTLAVVAVMLFEATALHGQASSQSPHEGIPEGVTCGDCHSTASWTPLRSDLRFDHGVVGFVLDGQHSGLSCIACHSTTRFDDLPPAVGECATCHVDVHQDAFDRTCVACHSTDSFSRVEAWAVHPADFPLDGAHLQVTCESCHTDDFGGAFVSLDADCVACHVGDYASTVLIDHEALGFPTECTQCHSNFAWRDVADFDHAVASGGFELLGTHMGLECIACHTSSGGAVPNPPSDVQDCVACHQADYQGEHAGGGFPTECVLCHQPTTWGQVNFNHDSFVQDCVACHEAEYDREHGGSGFPTDCMSCHTTTDWDQVTFSHNTFPIFSGPHDGKWSDCATCHTEPASSSSFTCFNCHQHRQSAMDDKHKEEPGYVYESSFCYSCHTNGKK